MQVRQKIWDLTHNLPMSKNTIKKFLTIDEQIEHLKKDYKLVVNDERLFKRFLRKFNYSRLIYDYGIAIRNNFGMFLPNTNSTDIINVYNFDTVIKERLLSKIFNIEKRLGTAIAYYVAKEMKNKWLCDDGKLFRLSKNKRNIILKSSSQKFLKRLCLFYIRNNVINQKIKGINDIKMSMIKDIPIWEVTRYWEYGTTVNFLMSIKINSIKVDIINSFANHKIINVNDKHIDTKINNFISAISVLGKVRNKCCHNNKLFDVKFGSPIVKNVADFIRDKINPKYIGNSVRLWDIATIIDYLNPVDIHRIDKKATSIINSWYDLLLKPIDKRIKTDQFKIYKKIGK